MGDDAARCGFCGQPLPEIQIKSAAANAKELGRQIVEAIREFGRRSGPDASDGSDT